MDVMVTCYHWSIKILQASRAMPGSRGVRFELLSPRSFSRWSLTRCHTCITYVLRCRGPALMVVSDSPCSSVTRNSAVGGP